MHRRFTFVLFALMASTALFAQEYKQFKVGLGLGYILTDNTQGIAIYLEPAYRIEDHISVGLRLELAGGTSRIDDPEVEVGFHSSYTLNGQYYFSNGDFRPLIGLGMGIYQTTSLGSDGTTNTGDLDLSPELGIYPRVGFDYGSLNVIIDYNFLPVSEGALSSAPNNRVVKVKNSYLSLKLGFSIGGGKKSKF